MSSQHHNTSSLSGLQLNLNVKAINDYDRNEEQLGLANDSNLQAVPSFCGIPLKYLSLVTLAVQNSLLSIIMHYSRVSTPPSRTYSAATAVLLNELLKGFISLIIAFFRVERQSNSNGLDLLNQPSPYPNRHGVASSPWGPKAVSARFVKLWKEVFCSDCWKLSIPAILYVIQNNLQYVAASNLNAATFQVTYQMKILTTAAFSVLLLRKKLSPTQWIALLCLAIGVGIVQIQNGSESSPSTPSTSQTTPVHSMQAIKGFLAVAAACFTSGLAGVYFEMVLKNSQGDLWVRNVQLSLFSLLPALVPVFFNHSASSAAQDGSAWFGQMFANFGGWAWATVVIQVFGGLITALVIKYADNIMKGFATSLSIVISFLASVALFDFRISFTFVLGSTVVLVATWLYNQQPSKRPSSGSAPLTSWSLGWGSVPEKDGHAVPLKSPAPDYTPLPVLSTTSSLSSSMVSLIPMQGSPKVPEPNWTPARMERSASAGPITFGR